MFKQSISKILARFHGWKLTNDIPEEVYRCVFIFAPHTSNWDFYFGMISMFAWGIPVKVAIKNFWTQFPFNLIIKPIGGIGIDRTPKGSSNRRSQVESMAAVFEDYDKIALIITPEGSRSKRTEWKTGFYHIANKANVPIVMMTAGYDDRKILFGPVLDSQEPLEVVMKKLMTFYKEHGALGKFPEDFALDERWL